MIRPGVFVFPVHEPTLARDLIRTVQPSLVKVWTSVTSASRSMVDESRYGASQYGR